MSQLEAIKSAVEKIILDPKYADILGIVKGARNGAVYGAKVRFPHALVMVFLFRSGTLQEKLSLIFKATRTHAQNLAKFAVIYKSTMLAMKHLGTGKGKEGPVDTLIAGLLGGYLVFGQRSARTGKIPSVNQQIVVYVFARVVLALAKLAVAPHTGVVRSQQLAERIGDAAWPVFAASSWALVMWVFRWHPETLQGSLRSSMKYIYVDSDAWDGLRTLVLHNK